MIPLEIKVLILGALVLVCLEYLKKKKADADEAERQASLANGHDWQFSS